MPQKQDFPHGPRLGKVQGYKRLDDVALARMGNLHSREQTEMLSSMERALALEIFCDICYREAVW